MRALTALLILGLGGCPPRATHTETGEAATGANPMIDSLKQMSDVLSAAPMPAVELAAKVGTVTRDLGGDLQVELRPSDARFASGSVTRAAGTGQAASIELVVANGASLRLADLEAAFGAGGRAPKAHAGGAERVSFHLAPLAGRGFTCTVVADVDGDRVSRVVLVREVVLAD